MRRRSAPLAAAATWLALAVVPAVADCGPTTLDVTPARARVGQDVTIDGTRFSFCDDTSGPCVISERTPTYDSVTVVLTTADGTRVAELGTAAIDDGVFALETEVPPVPPGRYPLEPVVDGRPWDVGEVVLRVTGD